MKKLILFAFILLVVAACDKNESVVDTPASDGKYLQKVNYWSVTNNSEVTIREIVLNSIGEATALRTYTNNVQGGTSGQVIWEFTTFEKDATGKIIKINGNDKQQNKPISYQFTYDVNGNITRSLFRQDGADNRTRNYTFDSSNRIIAEEELANNNNNKKVYTKTYSYTGNAVNPTTEVYDQILFSKITTTTLKFDDKKNPSQAAPTFMYCLGLIDFYKNNVIESTVGTTNSKITLTYNKLGFASSSTNGSGAGLKYIYSN